MGKENDSLDINEKIELLDVELKDLYILKDEFMDVKSEIYIFRVSGTNVS